MKELKLALAGLLMPCALTPASAKILITEDNGGIVVNFVRKYSDIRDSGEKVVIDGPCASSCTLLLGLLRPENFCATTKALFGFHSASAMKEEDGKVTERRHAPEMSALMFSLYPAKVRRLLQKRGWNGYTGAEHTDLIWVAGRALARKCTVADLS